jgi:glycogen debranching enzyme
MRDKLVVVDGSTFFTSEHNGDTEGDGCDGFFFRDTRHLSAWQLFVDDSPISALTSDNVDYYSARIVGVLDATGDGETPQLTVQRDRIVADGIHEDVSVENHGTVTREVTVELRYRADFADMFEIRASSVEKRKVTIDVEDRAVTMSYEHEGFRRGTCLKFTESGRVGREAARFTFTLQPHARWGICIDVLCIDGDAVHGPRARHGGFGQLHPLMPLSLTEWIDDSPALDCDVDVINATYHQSLVDLAALRFTPFSGDQASLPAAGLPWYMAILGRDALLTSYMALPFQPAMAAATLEILASLQATRDDPFRDAEPGKLPHELRFGELTKLGAKPHSPYFGSHDVTPLFLILLDEYERWTGDVDLVSRLEPAARAALQWIEGPGATDGYLYYETRSAEGLLNQCWKDSPDSIMFADGRLATVPLATCEIQGYAFDARRRMARLARQIWNDPILADRLDVDAAALAQRFESDFWCDERRHAAVALDATKQRVDSLTSNIGHLLWSGIVNPDGAAELAEHLMGDDLFSGWGIRTLAASSARFNPIHYHNGSVWPHDTALVAEGLRRYGYRQEASRLVMSLFEAAGGFGHRLPELFAGFDRDTTTIPIEYAKASSPQAWASAAPLLGLRTLLGLDVVDDALSVSPHLPDGLHRLNLRGVPVRGRRVDVG